MPKRDPSAIVQLKVRMRESMRDEIERAAKEAGHSMNAEIIRRLETWGRQEALEKRWDAIDQRDEELLAETKRLEQQLDVIVNALKNALDHRLEDKS